MMDAALSQEENRLFDQVITRRRSIRAFKSEPPPEGWIEEVLFAGLQAPYAGLATQEDVPYRLFKVIRQGPNMIKVQGLIKEQARVNLKQFEAEMANNAFLRANGQAFAKRLESIAEHGVPSLKNAPFFIVVAERKGVPSVEFESLAHCLQNMWLKATALGLGFQLLSVTKMLSQNRQFFQLMNLEYGQFLLNGCAMGYPQHSPAEKCLFPIRDITTWL